MDYSGVQVNLLMLNKMSNKVEESLKVKASWLFDVTGKSRYKDEQKESKMWG